MKLCYASLYYNPAHTHLHPTAYLNWLSMRYLPEQMAKRGHEVHVVHLYPRDLNWKENGVYYHFVAAGSLTRSVARAAGRLLGRETARLEMALRPVRRIRELQPDLIHFHGTILTLNLFLLFKLLGRHAPPVVLQYHGGYPSPNRWLRRIQRYNFRRSANHFFTTEWHIKPFIEAGTLDAGDARVMALMPQSTPLQWRPRSEARRQTGMQGQPIFLSVGRLHPVKDPLTALRGFEQILEEWRDAHFYLHYLTDELMPELQAYLDERPALAEHVHFRGRVSREELGAAYNSSDFLLQASQREFSGYALLEALACGVIPVVTDIPAFQMMTEGGRYGILFPRGDADALACGVLAVDPARLPTLSAEVRDYFERTLSYPALAARLERIYQEVLQEREPTPAQEKVP